tara:strand:+ start:6323 stop:7570 length:1248 start_codon:yes stop_codon:yes gene_type:complete
MAYTTVDAPQAHFKVKKYSGTSATDNAITFDETAVTMQPEVILVKNRDKSVAAGGNWGMYSIFINNQTGATKIPSEVYPNLTNAITNWATDASDGPIKSMDSNGFTLGVKPSNNHSMHNFNGNTHMAWCWKFGGNPTADNTATSGAMTANSISIDGTLQSSHTPSASFTGGLEHIKRVSVNTVAGCCYMRISGATNGDTFPHFLNTTPTMIWKKPYSDTGAMEVSLVEANEDSFFHDSGTDNRGKKDDFVNNGSFADDARSYDNTSSVIAAEDDWTVNGTEDNHLWIWTETPGFSRFNRYEGNGNADGPKVMLGFKPALVIIKRVGASTPFLFFDNKNRTTKTSSFHNPLDDIIGFGQDQASDRSSTQERIEFYSNGFKIASSGTNINNDGTKYIFMAWAHTTIGGPAGTPPTAV